MKKILFLILISCSVFTASAFRIEYGNNIIISQPVYEDLYIAGGNVTINAPVYGDLIIAGGTVIINDTVANDILLVAGTATFNGYVGDDIRCAGGNIRISKNVTGDVVITGGSAIIDKAAVIGGLIASGGNITVNGTVNGDVMGAFGDLSLNGDVFKNIDCRGGKITVNGHIRGRSILAARDIIIGNNAVFTDDVRYWNNKGVLDIKSFQKSGKVTYDASLSIKTEEWYYLGATTILGLLWYLGMALIMILVIQYLFSATFKRSAGTVFSNTLKSLGVGFLFCIVVPVAAIVAFITLIGIPVGLLLIFGYIVLMLLSTVISSVVAANWLNNRYHKVWNNWHISFVAFGIFILLKLIAATPFAGWLIMMAIVCIAFGGIFLSVKREHRNKQPIVM